MVRVADWLLYDGVRLRTTKGGGGGVIESVTTYETKLRHKRWSHMVSTEGPDELHAMAARLGLKREWFQSGSFDHYDITPPKRQLALKLGALEVNARLVLFGNYDYRRRRPTCFVPDRYVRELAAIGVVVQQPSAGTRDGYATDEA